MPTITSERELQRANVRVAWSFAHRMTADQFDELCRVTLAVWSAEGRSDDGPAGPLGRD